ncbi:MAG: hypothetical protein LBT25_02815 [Candidatus Symbiothrix sp.]|jgi:hypothetical protein|nr:hypothetical protein [Candidatus Symbiothrix sp.]
MTKINIILLIIVTMFVFFQSCNNKEIISSREDEGEGEGAFLSHEEASLLAVDYLYLRDSVFYLELSKKQALNLGLTEFQYNRALQEVARANVGLDSIRRHLKDFGENYHLVLPYPQKGRNAISDPQKKRLD